MDQDKGAGSHDLLTCFFKECESQFRFLEEEYGYLYLSGLVQQKGNCKIIRPYNEVLKDVSEPFYAITRYERNLQTIEIFFGDTNNVLEVFIYPNVIQRLSVRELIRAARGDVSTVTNTAFLNDPRTLAPAIKNFSALMRQNSKVLAPSDKLIDRALIMRNTLLEQGIRAHLERLIKDAVKRAAEAFVRKDYARVVDLLIPFEGYLNPSDLKKLRLAREKLS